MVTKIMATKFSLPRYKTDQEIQNLLNTLTEEKWIYIVLLTAQQINAIMDAGYTIVREEDAFVISLSKILDSDLNKSEYKIRGYGDHLRLKRYTDGE